MKLKLSKSTDTIADKPTPTKDQIKSKPRLLFNQKRNQKNTGDVTPKKDKSDKVDASARSVI